MPIGTNSIALSKAGVYVILTACMTLLSTPSEAGRWGAKREYREGMAEIARERREMRRDILNSNSRGEARQAYREGMREIGRERREMRREVGRELRHGRWNQWERERRRDRAASVVAGVVLGAVVVAAARGVAPSPPAPGLCWVWENGSDDRGYWDECAVY